MWIYVIAILTGLCFAALLYAFNKKQHYGKVLTAMLFILRSVTVALLVLILFNPYFKSKVSEVEPATIIIAQDNSASLVMTKDSTFYKDGYPLSIDTLIERLENDFTVDKYLFGNEIKELDTIDFQDYHTDISEMLNYIKKSYYKKNVGAVILLSDGICNKSYVPEQNIESYPFPIYTVTLGDTTNYPDFYIKDLFYNKTTPANSVFPLRLVANANNCRGEIMRIELMVDNVSVDVVEIPVNSNRFSHTFDFNIDSEEEGVKQIDIRIKTIENETVTANNGKRIFVEVVDKQYKVLFYAKSPHPDLGSLKNTLGDNFEIETIFFDDEIPDLRNYDVLLLHQIPYAGMHNYNILKSRLNENKEIPVFYIVGESTDFESFNDLQKSMTINRGAVNGVLDVKPYYNPNFGLFNVDDDVEKFVGEFPPLALPHSEFSLNANHDIFLQMNIRDVLTQYPLLSFCTDSDGRKNAYLLGTGVWRWKLNDFYKHKDNDNFEELFTKSVKYLLTEKDKELVVNYEEDYLNNEPILFTADLKNPSQELTNEPDLRIRVINKHSKDVFEYDFMKKDMSYYLNINGLPEGVYDFTAKAEFGEKTYLENGSFSVTNVGAEAQDIVANSQRMKLLSSLTGGMNFQVNEFNILADAVENDERITSILREETNYKDLINLKSIFFIVLSLVSIEWILRKMFGTY